MAPRQASCFPTLCFIFCIVVNPVNDVFMVDYILPHISLKYLSVPYKRHDNLLNGTRMVFQTIFVHLFMHQLFEFELCALMPKE